MGGGSAADEVPANNALICHVCANMIDDENHVFGACQNCGHCLTDIYPTLLPLLHRASNCQIVKAVAAVENLCLALQEVGIDVTVRELDSFLSPLAEKKGTKQQDDDRWNIKLEELNKVQADLQRIMEDINAIQSQRNELWTEKPNMADALTSMQPLKGTEADLVALECSVGSQKKDTSSPGDYEIYTQSRLDIVTQLPEIAQVGKHPASTISEGHLQYPEDCMSVASTFMAKSQLRVIAELDYKDLFQPSGIISSIEFDTDEQLLAVAVVPNQIKVFDFSMVMNEPADKHYPVAELYSSCKLSCLSWNKSMKNQIGCSDYQGTITIWDVTTCQIMKKFSEHERRIWSIDFSLMEPSMLASGSDDCNVKIWSTKQKASVLNIEFAENVCSVKYSPDSCNYLAVGSADKNIHYFDLRNTKEPLHVFQGHDKAVSYVKFSSASDLVSASTDSTLRLWDAKNYNPVRTFKGHINRRNFVGLSLNSYYVACGSETNEVVVYHKDITRPIAWYEFPSSDYGDAEQSAKADSPWVSSVCWKGNSLTMVAANSQGKIRVLSLGV